jgi:hypothetical protein
MAREAKQWSADDRAELLNREKISTGWRIASAGLMAVIAGVNGIRVTSGEFAGLGAVAIVVGLGLVLLMHRDLRKAKQQWYEAHKAAERDERRS